ncbi:DUF99 family protein [Methanobacterium alcaliphilum]|uniref:endonuclease dU n=1 Tax=Methanobacterium alcaliphilum TaxID=392018 RepID=UPI00200A5B18|nr:DUF99 family protein [Methanobacterium alcaliphilum]MCK9151013.1 DUF99 family protein [Methanobacterium alcaliphilum]
MNNQKFRKIKPEIRILGIDDAPFTPHKEGEVLIVGTVFRGGFWLDGVLTTHIQVDGSDSTNKIVTMVSESRQWGQIRVIILDGITFGGFNVVDIREIYKKTDIPVIVIMRKIPKFEKIKKALQKFPDWEDRWDNIKKAGKVYEVRAKEPIFVQISGIDLDDAIEIVKLSTTRSAIPEPIRAAHIIAAGVETGESKGNA